jgi:TRAP-type mannitol/chloroaromatic compound transport system permease small subunit
MVTSTVEKIMAVVDSVSSKAGKFGGFLFLLLTATVLYEVIARYVFHAPTIWSYKLTAPFLWGGACLLTSAWVLLENRHVSIDLVSARLSPRGAAILSMVMYLILFFPFVSIIFWKGIDQAAWSWKILQTEYDTPWRAPLYPIKTLIPVAALLLLVQGIVKWVRDLLFVIGRRKP